MFSLKVRGAQTPDSTSHRGHPWLPHDMCKLHCIPPSAILSSDFCWKWFSLIQISFPLSGKNWTKYNALDVLVSLHLQPCGGKYGYGVMGADGGA